MTLEGLCSVCAKLEPASSKSNEILKINVLQKFTSHADGGKDISSVRGSQLTSLFTMSLCSCNFDLVIYNARIDRVASNTIKELLSNLELRHVQISAFLICGRSKSHNEKFQTEFELF